jgi:hypothetical protein
VLKKYELVAKSEVDLIHLNLFVLKFVVLLTIKMKIIVDTPEDYKNGFKSN